MSASAPSTSRLQIKLREVGETYWFWPLLLGLAGLGLALITLAIDQSFTAKAFYETYPWLKVTPESGRAVLSVIAGAMISAASIVYSLSLLIRTIAIGTLGPRLIEAFDKVRVNRITLGMQLFSFIYSLTVLYGIANIVDPRTLSVALGIAIALVALVGLVVFVHSVARQAHVDATIADIAQGLAQRLDEETGDAGERGGDASSPDTGGEPVECKSSGYVQGIDRRRAFEIACAEDLTVAYDVRSGDYVTAGLPLLRIASKGRFGDEVAQGLADTVTIGAQRIDAEDLRFRCLLLVEVALRALSTGVNDPFTAIACIDNLGGVLARIDGRDLTPEPLCDGSGNLRVVSRALSYQHLVDAIFDPLRQSGANVPMVALRLIERIGDLAIVTSRQAAREHLVHHARLILAEARKSISHENDIEALKSRMAEIEARVTSR